MPSDFLSFEHLRFAPDLAYAEAPLGQRVRFSRHERALLTHFIAHPQMLIGRNRLLDVISPQDSSTLDRNIDYLISRLRRKLGDTARNPRFIATQYGEGYHWVAKQRDTSVVARERFIMIGPILGLHTAPELSEAVGDFLEQLRQALSTCFGHSDAPVVLAPVQQDNIGCRYALEISFLKARGILRCSCALRDGKNGHIFQTWQYSQDLQDTRDSESLRNGLVREVHSAVLLAAIHKPSFAHRSTEMPLAVALDQAAQLFSTDNDKYQQVSDFLRNKLAENPDDHHSAILLASSLHVALIRNSALMKDPEKIPALMTEIETLVIQHLAGIQREPLFLSAAAKLLYFVGHYDLAEELASAALDLGPSYAATQMVYAQIKMFQGDLEEALEYYEFALTCCEPDSQFQSMILVLKATALLAAGEVDDVPEIVRKVIDLDESVRATLSVLLLADISRPEPMVAVFAKTLSAESWQYLLRHIYCISVRLFQVKRHRERIISPSLNLAMAHVGKACLIEELKADLPELC